MISDDVVWLGNVTAQYVAATGDTKTQILADDSEESAIDARIAELEKVGSSQVHTSHACYCHFFFAVKLMNLSVS